MMSDIKVNSIVEVKSLESTVGNYGYSDNLPRLGTIETVTDVLGSCVYINQCGLELHAGDLVVLNEITLEQAFRMFQGLQRTGLPGVEVTIREGKNDIDGYSDFQCSTKPIRIYDLDCDYDHGEIVHVIQEDDYGDDRWYEFYLEDVFIKVSSIYELLGVEQIEVKPTYDLNTASYIITEDTVSLTFEGDVQTIDDSHPNFDTVVDAIIDKDFELAWSSMNVSKAIERYTDGVINIEHGQLFFKGTEITNKLTDKIISMMADGDESFEKYTKFLELVLEQESYKTRLRLMDFVSAEEIDITDDGMVIAFKNVRDDYLDKHTGTIDNSVGQAPEMLRMDVDDDHNNTCSSGLHVASPHYLRSFWGTSGRTLLVHVDPRHFVAIPPDYNDSKARVEKYLVVEDVTNRKSDFNL